MLGKSAEMGVGTLIVFIAMLLVAAVAAGVLIQTVGSLQEKSLSTGQQARSQISTNTRVIEVSASDGRNGNLTDFQQIIKLSPGSDPIKLDQVIFTVNTKDKTSTLKYRGKNSVCKKNNSNGYNTWNVENIAGMEVNKGFNVPDDGAITTVAVDCGVDLDDDGQADTVIVCDSSNCGDAKYDGGYLMFSLSTAGDVMCELRSDNGTLATLDNIGSGFNISYAAIGDYGYVTGWRSAGSNAYQITPIDSDVYFQIYESPYRLDEDLNDDGGDDFLTMNETHFILRLSDGEVFNASFGVDVCSVALPYHLQLSAELGNLSDTLATVAVDAIMTQACVIPNNYSITVTPYREGEGYFSAIYEIDGTNHVEENLQRGDIVRLCYEAPGEITEDSLVRLSLIPKTGTPTLTQFVTPDVISTQRVYLYP